MTMTNSRTVRRHLDSTFNPFRQGDTIIRLADNTRFIVEYVLNEQSVMAYPQDKTPDDSEILIDMTKFIVAEDNKNTVTVKNNLDYAIAHMTYDSQVALWNELGREEGIDLPHIYETTIANIREVAYKRFNGDIVIMLASVERGSDIKAISLLDSHFFIVDKDGTIDFMPIDDTLTNFYFDHALLVEALLRPCPTEQSPRILLPRYSQYLQTVFTVYSYEDMMNSIILGSFDDLFVQKGIDIPSMPDVDATDSQEQIAYYNAYIDQMVSHDMIVADNVDGIYWYLIPSYL